MSDAKKRRLVIGYAYDGDAVSAAYVELTKEQESEMAKIEWIREILAEADKLDVGWRR